MNERKNKEYILQILKIAIPIIVGNIIAQVQMIIDKAFLGHVNDMYLSALGNVTTLLWSTISVCSALAIGASILISQSVGAKDEDKMKEYAATMMKWGNVLPFLIFCFWIFFGKHVFVAMGISENVRPMCQEYLRFYAPIFLIVGFEVSIKVIMQTSNYTRPLVYYGLLRAGLNVVLDYVLIFGHFGLPAMGIGGAALATTISEYVGIIYAFVVLATSDKLHTRPKLKDVLKAKVSPYIHTLKLGVNSALEDFAWNFGNLMMIRILNTISEKAAGIYTIVFSVELVAVVIVGAIGIATMTLTGEAYGEKNQRRYRKVTGLAYLLTLVCAFVNLGFCLVIPEPIIRLFTADETIIPQCCGYLLLICVNLFGKSANIILGNGIRGSGDTRWMFLTQIFGTVFVIGCGVLFVFVFHLGISGVLLAVIADEIVRALINLVRFRGISKRMENSL